MYYVIAYRRNKHEKGMPGDYTLEYFHKDAAENQKHGRGVFTSNHTFAELYPVPPSLETEAKKLKSKEFPARLFSEEVEVFALVPTPIKKVKRKEEKYKAKVKRHECKRIRTSAR